MSHISRSLLVWREARVYTRLEDHHLGDTIQFVDGKKAHADQWRQFVGTGDRCDVCGACDYLPGDPVGLVSRFRDYRSRRGIDMWAAHGNVKLGKSIARHCPFCGFAFHLQSATSGHMGQADWSDLTVARLKLLNINDAEIGLKELGAHVRRCRDDVHSISSVRYEELLEDVYKNLGYRVIRTQATHDGGYDLRLYGNGNEQILVECKRWRRTVGVRVVRELVGVVFSLGMNRGCIVTPSRFSRAAERFSALAAAPRDASSFAKIEVSLVELQSLLNGMNVYNAVLPPLDVLDKMGEEKARALLVEYASQRNA